MSLFTDLAMIQCIHSFCFFYSNRIKLD
ncbi:hypothetical protein OIU78_020276 [Salix suchowensis]|nr:hypothetical protein OIU78_020276 [Salix suchowensis]